MRFPLQKTEELGLDRPTFIWAINLSYRGDRGASAEPGDLTSVYGTIPGRWRPMVPDREGPEPRRGDARRRPRALRDARAAAKRRARRARWSFGSGLPRRG